VKVVIYRGEAQHTERKLEGQTLRIGRSADNDIVLEDVGKGVSRHHAEIRFEDDGYTLVDLGSQNGIWVSGSRVPSVRLEPGVAAAVGPYRVTVPEPVAAVAAAPEPTAEEESPLAPTEYIRPGDAHVVSGVGGLLDPAAETGPREAILPPSPPVPAPRPAAAASTSKPAPRDGGASTVRSAQKSPAAGGKSNVVLFAAAAVVLLAGIAFGAYELVHKTVPRPVWSRDAAVALVNRGRCQDAMQQQIGPALAANPNDADALALKMRCAPPPPPPKPVPVPAPAPPPDPSAQALDAIDASLAANDCQSALDAVTAVLANVPDNTRAQDLKTKAEDCVKAAAQARPAAPRIATAMPPSQGGLDVQGSETPQDYARRVQAMKKRYDDAVALLQAQHYVQALKEFDAIAPIVPAGYRDLVQRRSDARAALRDEAARQYAAGQQAEQKNDFASALQHYQRVHEIDASHDVSGDIARVNDTKSRLGHTACTNGNANYLVSRNADAAAQYSKVLELLPESDPCYKQAKDRLAIINRR
jgi:tetratricopeptide (TPR) repeat protein